MQPDAPHLSINLGKERTDTTTGLLFKWVVNAGRIITIIVELLTLGALGYRFVIDRQIVDLHDKIVQEQLFINAQAKKETLYRNLETRLSSIQTLNTQIQERTKFMKSLLLLTNTPEYASTNLTISDTSVSIEGNTGSIFSVNSLIDTLKKDPNVSSISIDDLTSLDQGGVKFRVSIQL